MEQETLTVYLCPFCEKSDVLCYRKYVKKFEVWDFVYSYLGLCCEYYPHENKVVEAALKRMEPKRSEIPRHCNTETIDKSRKIKRMSRDC